MQPNINMVISDKPNANDTLQRHSGPVFPVCIPRIPKDLFPITSQEDLVTKLTAALSPPSTPVSYHGDALPAGNAPPPARK
jgi:hypothetical protein